jgi:hypothetical protein
MFGRARTPVARERMELRARLFRRRLCFASRLYRPAGIAGLRVRKL